MGITSSCIKSIVEKDELGHALGLPHCEYPGCVMYFSNWIGDTDRKGPKFCYRCGKRIERLVEVGRG